MSHNNVNTCIYSNLTFEEAMENCIHILNQDEHTIIPSLLELLGKYYNADKAHFYRIDYSNTSIVYEYLWSNKNEIEIVKDLSLKMDVTSILSWLQNRNEIGMIEGDSSLKSCDTNSIAGKILHAFHLDNIVLSVLENSNKEPIGLIGISNKKEQHEDYQLLQIIAKFIEMKACKIELRIMLQEIMEHDLLTNFYSRFQYLKTIHDYETTPPKQIGVLFCTINGLKNINTEHGLTHGDTHIRKSAEKLQQYLNMDFYRTSGDEFVGLYPNISEKDFEKEVNHLLNQMNETGDYSFTIGHAWGDKNCKLLDLIQTSEKNMYINKQPYYTSDFNVNDISSRTLTDLLKGLEEHEFLVYLQPQMNLKTNMLHGAEALVRRYDKAANKLVFPNQFIPLYERKLIIRHIDLFIINQVCRILSEWIKLGKEVPISVNLSRITLLEYGIVETIVNICNHYHIPHHLLVIEVTEQEGSIENDIIRTLVYQFQTQGFKVSLDDFGCAYSNIVTLAQVDVDEVKIDKSLVDQIVTCPRSKLITKNILNMCNELDNISTLAEGIETQEQADILKEFNCQLGQGYLYSKPIPIEEFHKKYIA